MIRQATLGGGGTNLPFQVATGIVLAMIAWAVILAIMLATGRSKENPDQASSA